MPLVRTRALVLQAFPYGDTSKILRLFTPDLGVRSVIAKGAQRPKSRFGGLLEPFTEGEAHFYLKEGRDLHTLTGFDLLRSRQAIGRDLTAFSGASLMAELIIRTGTEEPQPELFARLSAALDQLVDADPASSGEAALQGLWAIVSLLGFEPELDRCVHCGRELGAEETARFDVDAGGAACLACRPSGRLVEPAFRAELRGILAGAGPRISPENRPVHRALVRAFLPAHLAHERPLRSLELFAESFR